MVSSDTVLLAPLITVPAESFATTFNQSSRRSLSSEMYLYPSTIESVNEATGPTTVTVTVAAKTLFAYTLIVLVPALVAVSAVTQSR